LEDIAKFLEDLGKHIEESAKTTKVGSEIKFPLTVKSIQLKIDHPIKKESRGQKAGAMVMVRSVKDEHGDKTRLGILVGFVPLDVLVLLKHPEGNATEGNLIVQTMSDNPVIFIPELNECVLGAESWWGPIKSEAELKQITDTDIQNVWYVKAMKELAAKAKNGDAR